MNTHHPLHLLLNPSSIAIVGANNNPMKMGTMHALSILKDGFAGTLYPVHPREKEVLGLVAYPSVEKLPVVPDLAILVVPSSEIINLVEEFGKRGTRRIIIITAGFRETGDKGKAEEERLKETAARYGIRFLGPNCMGVINTSISLNTTVMTLNMKEGRLGMVSQSGTYISQTLSYLAKRGIRFSKAISVGNSTDISLTDALEYLGDDEATTAIALYIEGIAEPKHFLEVAKRIVPKKPIVAQYVGGSIAGARASQSHTGALAASDHLYDGLFKQAGIIRVYSVEDLYGHGWMLASQPRLKGNRVAVLTNSGGPGSSMAHTCEKQGFIIPEFSPHLRKKIEPLVPPHAPCGNPVDITFSMDVEVLSRKIPEIVMESGEVDAVVLHGTMRSGFIKAIYPHIVDMLNGISLESILDMVRIDFSASASLPKKYGIPMAISSFFDFEDDFTTAYHAHDVPVYDSPEKAAIALASLLRYREILQRVENKNDVFLTEKRQFAESLLITAKQQGQTVLDEFHSKRIIASYGLPIADEVLVYGEDELQRAIETIGFPLVLKACSHTIPHKTGKGLIFLNVNSTAECLTAFRNIQTNAGQKVPVLASRMIKGEREFMVGFLRHELFGGVVLFGIGGIFAETINDVTFRLAPLSISDARYMIEDIKHAALLQSVRNLPHVDVNALANIIAVVSSIGVNHPHIQEIDINPIIIEGASPVIVDALIVLK
ncbi:MAG: acetate--CoA ligase family protein [Spirochaetes bacterium]|nr:acetate--CoA ligase family protein [Spirochaetota bacterium]